MFLRKQNDFERMQWIFESPFASQIKCILYKILYIKLHWFSRDLLNSEKDKANLRLAVPISSISISKNGNQTVIHVASTTQTTDMG